MSKSKRFVVAVLTIVGNLLVTNSQFSGKPESVVAILITAVVLILGYSLEDAALAIKERPKTSAEAAKDIANEAIDLIEKRGGATRL